MRVLLDGCVARLITLQESLLGPELFFNPEAVRSVHLDTKELSIQLRFLRDMFWAIVSRQYPQLENPHPRVCSVVRQGFVLGNCIESESECGMPPQLRATLLDMFGG